MNIIYSKYNRNRKPSFQIKTMIVEDETRLYVEKYALNHEAKPHIENIYNNYTKQQKRYNHLHFANAVQISQDGVRFEYINGKTMDALLLETVSSKNAMLFLQYIKEYMNFLKEFNPVFKVEYQPSREFTKIFGCTPVFENVKCMAETNVDLTFDNVILHDSNKVIIDYEWIFDTEVPLDFIVFRSISRFFWKYGDYLDGFMNIEDIFRELDIGYLEEYQEMERGFQAYVLGNREHELGNQYKRNHIKISELQQNVVEYKHKIEEQSNQLEEARQEIERLKEEKRKGSNEMNEVNRKLTHCLFQSDHLKDEVRRLELINKGLQTDKDLSVKIIERLETAIRVADEKIEVKLSDINELEKTFRGRISKKIAGKKYLLLYQSAVNENNTRKEFNNSELIHLNNTEITELRKRLQDLENYVLELEEEKNSNHLELNHLRSSLHDVSDKHHRIVLENEHLLKTNHKSSLKLEELNEAFQLLQKEHHQMKYDYNRLSQKLYQGLREEEEH
ncbi:Chromosome partition protein Smc [compost metagenome]